MANGLFDGGMFEGGILGGANSMVSGIKERVVGWFSPADNELLGEKKTIRREVLSREVWTDSFEEDPLKQKKADDEIINVLDRKVEISDEERSFYKPQWAMNRAFYVGNQWAVWNPISGSMELPESERTRIVINRLRSIVRSLVARLTRNKPKLTAVATDYSDPSDKDQAKVSELALDFELDRLQYRRLLARLIQWIMIEGKAYFLIGFDNDGGKIEKATVDVTKYAVMATDDANEEMMSEPEVLYSGPWPATDKGEPIRFDEEEVRTPDDLTEKDLEKQFSYMEGAVTLDVVPLHEIYWEPGSLSLDDSQWVVHSRRESIEKIRQNSSYKNTEDVRPDEGIDDPYDYEASVGVGAYMASSRWLGSVLGNRKGSHVTNRTAVVKTYYERPSVRHAKGLMIVWSGKTLLYKGDLPCGEMPLIEVMELDEPNRFCPVAKCEDLMSPQYAYNLSTSQEVEYAKQLVIGSWVYKENSVENPPIGYSGEHIIYRGDAPPRRMDQPSMPNSAFEIARNRLVDMHEIAGLNEAARGVATTNITSGIHAKLLIEADDSKLGPYSDMIEISTERVGNLILKYMREYYVEERLVEIIGDNRQIQVLRFKGEDLHYNVKVMQSSSLSQSRILHQEEIYIKWKDGYYGDPANPETMRHVHKLMDEGSSAPQSSMMTLNTMQAKRENLMAEEGKEIPEITPWEDTAVHEPIHIEWLLSESGRQAGPDAQQRMWEHITMGREAAAAMANPEAFVDQQIQQQQMAGGGGGMPGGAADMSAGVDPMMLDQAAGPASMAAMGSPGSPAAGGMMEQEGSTPYG